MNSTEPTSYSSVRGWRPNSGGPVPAVSLNNVVILWSHDIAKVDTFDYILFNMERFGWANIGAKSDKSIKKEKLYEKMKEFQKEAQRCSGIPAPVLATIKNATVYQKNKIQYWRQYTSFDVRRMTNAINPSVHA